MPPRRKANASKAAQASAPPRSESEAESKPTVDSVTSETNAAVSTNVDVDERYGRKHIHAVPAELLVNIFLRLGRNVYQSSMQTQAELMSIFQVCRRWRDLVRPFLQEAVACESRTHVSKLFGRLTRPGSDPMVQSLRTVSIVLDCANTGSTDARIQMEISASLMALLLDACPNIAAIEVGARRNPLKSLSVLLTAELRSALKKKVDLDTFAIVSSSGKRADTGPIDINVLADLLPSWPKLTRLSLDGYLRCQPTFEADPPPCQLKSLWLGNWFDGEDVLGVVDWILGSNKGQLREFRCSEGFFPQQEDEQGEPTETTTLPYLCKLLSKHGSGLRSLDLGLFLCNEVDLDFNDFYSLLVLCPSLLYYTHGDIVIDTSAVELLSKSPLRELRIYHGAILDQADLFAKLLHRGKFADLRALQIVVDGDPALEQSSGKEETEEIREACLERGIDFMHSMTRRFRAM